MRLPAETRERSVLTDAGKMTSAHANCTYMLLGRKRLELTVRRILVKARIRGNRAGDFRRYRRRLFAAKLSTGLHDRGQRRSQIRHAVCDN